MHPVDSTHSSQLNDRRFATDPADWAINTKLQGDQLMVSSLFRGPIFSGEREREHAQRDDLDGQR